MFVCFLISHKKFIFTFVVLTDKYKMTLIDFLGYVAAFGTTSAFFPQAYKVYRTKKTDDLSIGTFLLMSFGIVMWFIYGYLINSTPMLLANGFSFMMVCYILVMKIRQIKIPSDM